MSPLWGQARWHHDKWGYLGLPAEFERLRKVWSNPHPWVRRLGYWPYSRSASFAVYHVDPDTLANGQQLPRIAGGTRESNWEDVPLQTESLTLTFMNPDEYLPGGAYASLVQPGQLLRVEWTARALDASYTVPCGLYRVTAAPQPDVDGAGAKTPQAEAEGWLEDPLRRLMLDGANPLGDAVKLRDAGLPLGLPVIWGVDTYATLVAALIWTASGQRLRIPAPWRTLNWWGTSSPTPTEPPPPAPPVEPPPPGETYYTAAMGVAPNTTNRGTLTNFQVSWDYAGGDPGGADQIAVLPAGLTPDQASTQAASLPADSDRLLPTSGWPATSYGADLTLDFGSGIAAEFWYWHRVHGCVSSPALCALL